MIIVLLGAPGSGKGTQAVRLAKEFSIPHISTGDIFRENIKNKTPLGEKVSAIMAAGGLCPDELTVQIVADRIAKEDCKNGFLLDGFPRNVFQAGELDKLCKVDGAVNLDIPLQKLMRRLTGRRSCPKCGGAYHIDFLENKELCPSCQSALVTRADDNEETVNNRLAVYEKQTAPVIEYYKKQNKVIDINGDNNIEKVFKDICEALKK